MRRFILVVEGETELSQLVRRCLQATGYTVHTASANEVMLEAEKVRPSLVLISPQRPSASGLSLCRRIRENPGLNGTPLVLLLAEDTEEQRIQGLESGADDCLVRPFSPRELVARVQAVLRGFTPVATLPRPEQPDLMIDSWAMKLFVRGTEVPTTSLEFRLIDYLARHSGQVFTRDLLLDAVWGDMEFVTPRSVDACVRRIREKIEPDRKRPAFLKTIRGVGYRLDAVADWQSPANEWCNCAACTTAVSASQSPYENSARRRRGPA